VSVVFCECVIGEHPFLTARTPADIRSGMAGAARKLAVVSDAQTAAFLVGALSTDHDRSPRTAAEFLDGLKTVAASRP